MKTFLLVTILIISFMLNADALTTSGVISKEETWSGEVILTGDVTVTGKLTVLPGTVIKCKPESDDQKSGADGNLIELIIDGEELIASGTEEKRIVFTSAAGTPAKGDWYGIRHLRGIVTLQYCDESFGVTGYRAEVYKPKKVEYCSFKDNSDKGVSLATSSVLTDCNFAGNSIGVYYEKETTLVRLERCEVKGNSSDGVSGQGPIRLENCTIVRNGGAGVVVGWDHTTATVSNCTITGNGSSGVSVVGSYSTVSVSGCTIDYNNGAGVTSWTVSVTDSIITNNSTGVSLVVTGVMGITRNVISENGIGVEKISWEKLEGLTGNDIFGNLMYELKNTREGEVIANDNYWGEPTTTELINKVANFSTIYDKQDDPKVGPVTISTYRTEPMPPTPTIKTVSPDSGSVSGGTRITMTGSRFVAGATVTVGSKSATEVSVDSETQITATVPVGTVGPADVTVTNPDGKSASKKAGFVYVEGPPPCSGIYQIDIALTTGVNSFSLPLRPETPITASQLAEDLGSTIVIRVQNGQFDAYVHDGKIGTDFPIEVGKGYIVNLRENRTYPAKGRPWGTEVPAAPTMPNNSTWAFVIAGLIEGTVPDGGRLRITNLRTGEKLVVPLPSVEQAASLLQNELAARSTVLEKNELAARFTAAFVDMNRRPVIAEGDEFIIQLIGMGGVSLTEAKRYIISHKELEQAYLLVYLSTKIKQTILLQNYPNPFNPETWIPFRLAENLDVKIRIYDLKGRLVRELALGRLEAGSYVSKGKSGYWDGRNEQGEQVASGVYFIELRAGSQSFVRRMVMMN